jgi:hypothetical protein
MQFCRPEDTPLAKVARFMERLRQARDLARERLRIAAEAAAKPNPPADDDSPHGHSHTK